MTKHSNKNKKLYIKSWGCQMNVYDSTRMADILRPMGYEPVDKPDGADLIILNTCHIREKATDKVFSEIGRLRGYKEDGAKADKKILMAVAGCVAQAEGEFILQRAPEVDMVFGPQTYHKLPEMILQATGERVVHTEFPAESKFDHLPEENHVQGASAFLAIQEGCDKFCTFCVVPYTRGAEFSRPVAQVLEEARRLIDAGAKEITLLGQNVNAYHGAAPKGTAAGAAGTWPLARLIEALAGLAGLERIRYTTSHPRDMSADLIAAHRDIAKLMPYLHLPVQSGADNVLKHMNRKHTADEYREIIAGLRAARPDIALSGDFIVGFPGETEADFEQTLQLVRDVGYASAYSFKYSRRPGTPGANMTGQLPEPVKARRLETLQTLLNAQQADFNRRTQGLTLPVLFERKGQKEGQIQGKTPYNQSVNVQGPARLLGHILPVQVRQSFDNSLFGTLELSDPAEHSEPVVKSG